jgi:hypothetical protein
MSLISLNLLVYALRLARVFLDLPLLVPATEQRNVRVHYAWHSPSILGFSLQPPPESAHHHSNYFYFVIHTNCLSIYNRKTP